MRFADCILDLDARRLVRGGEEDTSPESLRPAQVAGREPSACAVEDRAHRAVWPGVFVSDASLAKVVSRIRRAIGRTTTRGFRTVHGCGYAFAAESTITENRAAYAGGRPAACWLFAGGASSSWTVSTSSDATRGGHLAGFAKVSRRHANRGDGGTPSLNLQQERIVVADSCHRPETLVPGDDVRSALRAVFRVADGAGSTESEVR